MIKILKRIFSKGACSDCSWLMACNKCSERYDEVNKELKQNNF